MPDYFHSPHNEIGPRLQGSVLRGILGGIAGMFVCILAMLLCSLCQIGRFSIMLQLFTGMVIGWFYRLFHGRCSKTAAYVTVGICTVLACAFWVVLLVLLPAVVSHVYLTAADLVNLWGMIWKLLILCVGLGLVGFFFTGRGLLAYADWKRSPRYIAYAGGNGYSYNLLPEKLPAKNPPTCFAVHSCFAPGTRIIVEGSTLRWRRWFRKDLVFSAHDIAGVVLEPGNGCNVLYDKNYQVQAKFAGSMEHADLMLLWLLQREIPIDNAPAGWYSPAEDSPDPELAEASVLHWEGRYLGFFLAPGEGDIIGIKEGTTSGDLYAWEENDPKDIAWEYEDELVLGQEPVCFMLLTKAAAGGDLLEKVQEQTGLAFHVGF